MSAVDTTEKFPDNGPDLLRGILTERGWDVRPGQMKMVEAIGGPDHGGEPEVAVVAPVGTGKSLGYLAGALPWAERMVVTTSTKALQRQLCQEELPELQENLNNRYGESITFMPLMGQSNYIDISKTKKMLRLNKGDVSTSSMSVVELEELSAGEEFTPQAWETLEAAYDATVEAMEAGDYQHLDQADALASLPPKMRAAAVVDRKSKEYRKPWFDATGRPLSADEVIETSKCAYRTAYAYALTVDVLVINTALLAAEMVKARNRMGPIPLLLPRTDFIIVDEAHHAANNFTSALAFDHDLYRFREDSTDLIEKMRKAGLDETTCNTLTEEFKKYIEHVTDATDAGRLSRSDLANRANELSGILVEVVRRKTSAASGASEHLRRLGNTLDEDFRADLNEVANRILDRAETRDGQDYTQRVASQWRNDLVNGDVPYEDDLPTISLVPIDLTSVAGELSALCREPSPFVGEGLEAEEGGLGYLGLCSGTMTGEMPATLGMFDCVKTNVDSPFETSRQKLYLAKNLPAPKEADRWMPAAWGQVKEVIVATGGRTLFLCTSYRSLAYFAGAARDHLEPLGIRVLEQTRNTNKDEVLAEFRDEEASVLFGTLNSFGEGVDLPGTTLSLVVMDKINFPIPSDPIFKARAEAARRMGRSDFSVSLEQASVMAAQGAGRLIRSADCIGGVAMLDPRVVTTNYGKDVLRLLPKQVEWTDEPEEFTAWQKIVASHADNGERLESTDFKRGNWKPLSRLGERTTAKRGGRR